MVKLAPSKNPEKESKLFGNLALACGLISLLIWFVGAAALAFGIRGLILSTRVKNKKYIAFSILGIVLGVFTFGYHYLAK